MQALHALSHSQITFQKAPSHYQHVSLTLEQMIKLLSQTMICNQNPWDKTFGMFQLTSFQDVNCRYSSSCSCWAWRSSNWVSFKGLSINTHFSQACFQPSGYGAASNWVMFCNPEQDFLVLCWPSPELHCSGFICLQCDHWTYGLILWVSRIEKICQWPWCPTLLRQMLCLEGDTYLWERACLNVSACLT